MQTFIRRPQKEVLSGKGGYTLTQHSERASYNPPEDKHKHITHACMGEEPGNGHKALNDQNISQGNYFWD